MTYGEVAQTLGVRWCSGCALNRDHTRGFAEASTHTVHWHDRKLQKPGLRRFLILAAKTAIRMEGTPEDIYKVNEWAASRSRSLLHVSIPSRYSDMDRAQLRWAIHRGATVSYAAHKWAGR